MSVSLCLFLRTNQTLLDKFEISVLAEKQTHIVILD